MIISEDGLRPDALTGVRPPTHEAILKRAAYSFQAQTIRRASTLPSHAAMLSGFDVKEHGLYWNSWKPERGYIQVPTVFDAAKKGGGNPPRSWASTSSRTSPTRDRAPWCRDPATSARRWWRRPPATSSRSGPRSSSFTSPTRTISDTRTAGCRTCSSNPFATTDKCLATLVDAVSAAGLDGETLFIISADHGGHGHNHSGKIKEDRLIPWIAWGPGIRPGHRIKANISTVDTAATALWVLGYPPPPGMIGRPVLEAFEPDPP